MDTNSRIKEALEEIEALGTHDTLEGRSLIDGSVIPSQHIVTKSAKLAREVLGLIAATEPATVELPKCDHCGAICGTDCDGSSHYTPHVAKADVQAIAPDEFPEPGME